MKKRIISLLIFILIISLLSGCYLSPKERYLAWIHSNIEEEDWYNVIPTSLIDGGSQEKRELDKTAKERITEYITEKYGEGLKILKTYIVIDGYPYYDCWFIAEVQSPIDTTQESE